VQYPVIVAQLVGRAVGHRFAVVQRRALAKRLHLAHAHPQRPAVSLRYHVAALGRQWLAVCELRAERDSHLFWGIIGHHFTHYKAHRVTARRRHCNAQPKRYRQFGSGQLLGCTPNLFAIALGGRRRRGQLERVALAVAVGLYASHALASVVAIVLAVARALL
jgi:hypothetical protein